MSRVVRNLLRKHALYFAAKCVVQNLSVSRSGETTRMIQNDVANAILLRTYSEHFRNISKPTSIRMNLAEAMAFSEFLPVPRWGDTVWLVMVSDRAGRTGYGLAQEWSERVDPFIRESEARARAQHLACDAAIGNHNLRNMPAAGFG
ncbi:hypothetical protein [Paracoccus litorisediminis]|uniref:Uncharacterized protein n=1 Tax=Paracoccus litorisediminis TaxID=2006130 RepID=A0A844HJA1_9RHOB|nr:hypothetical protein [Paracoccus litorisediminis]MTH57881.1 hypothetical protein [Paracoccus litorisediminis]